ncbi:hypothetical protein VTO73DRAFT_3245 [Trametes versicolor]
MPLVALLCPDPRNSLSRSLHFRARMFVAATPSFLFPYFFLAVILSTYTLHCISQRVATLLTTWYYQRDDESERTWTIEFLGSFPNLPVPLCPPLQCGFAAGAKPCLAWNLRDGCNGLQPMLQGKRRIYGGPAAGGVTATRRVLQGCTENAGDT